MATIPSKPDEDSLRLPVILFLSSAIFWLVFGALLDCAAAWKLIVPSFLDGISWLTYGRIQPAAENAWIYGWVSQAGIGVGIWFLARLGRAALGSMRLLLVAGLFWNLAVLLGICSILAGYGNSFRGLEFSGGTALVLLIAYICIGVWSLSLLQARLGGGLYVTQWYLLAAFLCFPWLYGTANLLLVWSPVAGSAQGPIAAWYWGSLFWLWLAPLGLAAVYYLVPHVARRPVHAYPSSILAFWCLALLGGWAGTRFLLGGPIPAWMASAGVAASLIMLIPAALIFMNTLGTFRPLAGRLTSEGAFVAFALYSLAGVFAQAAATPWTSAVTHFSDYSLAEDLLATRGFLTMALFAAFYHVVPRLTGGKFIDTEISWHYWLSAWGVGTTFVALTLGGLIQGFALYDPVVDFMSSVTLAAPFRAVYALGNLVFLGACLIFAAAFTSHLLGINLSAGTVRTPVEPSPALKV